MSRSYRAAIRMAAAGVALAGGLVAAPAMATEWTGNRLSVTNNMPNCNLTITRGYGGSTLSPIWLTIRSSMSQRYVIEGTMRIAGGGNSKSGTMGTITLEPNTTNEKSTNLTRYGGDLSNTTLSITLTRCQPV